MSASPVARQVVSQAIPVSKRVVINHENELPSDVASTPGGTLFSTTPGGTRIIYDRATLMRLKNSPSSHTPPKNLPVIPGLTVPDNRPREVIEEETRDHGINSDDEYGPCREGSPPTDKPSPPEDDDNQFQVDL